MTSDGLQWMDWALKVFDPAFWVFDPSRRVYWLSLLTGLILAYVYVALGRMDKSFLRRFFSKSLWLSPSSLLDFKLIFANSFLKTLLLSSRLFTISFAALAVARILDIWFPDFNPVEHSDIVMMLWFSIAVFVAEDFGRFILHFMQHRFAVLWRFHKVHHSAEVLTPLTLNRTHPVDLVSATIRDIITVGGVSGIFLFLYGPRLSGFDILGVDALGFLFNAFAANLRHSEIPLGFGKLSKIFISPVMHQVHHSLDPKHFNKNLGTCFSVWDRMCGSLYIPSRREGESLKFGLDNEELNHQQSLLSAYFLPFMRR